MTIETTDNKGSSELNRVKKQFKTWRRTRGETRTQIPKKLWEAAIDLTQYHPISTVAKSLCLNQTELKKRVRELSQASPKEKNPSPIFVECQMDLPNTGFGECIIEMQTNKGDKLKIHLKGETPIDLNGLCLTFFKKR